METQQMDFGKRGKDQRLCLQLPLTVFKYTLICFVLTHLKDPLEHRHKSLLVSYPVSSYLVT